MQLFDRQATEDGPDPSSRWGPDRTELDSVDPDNEDTVPIPRAEPGPSKLSARYSNQDTFPKGPIFVIDGPLWEGVLI